MAGKSIGSLVFNFGANLQGFERAMQKAQKTVNKFGRNMNRTGQQLSRNITLPVLGLGAAFIKAASDMEETDAKFGTVFSSIRGEAEKTADTFKESFGLSEKAAKQLLGDTGDLLVGFGFTEQSALDLSTSVNQLAVDLASFSNFSGGAEGASLALTKALLGERESVKQLGIAITEADLKQFAADQGLVWKELDRVTKAQLTYQLMLKQSSKAVGDYARTSESFANQMRQLRELLMELAVSFGEILLPFATRFVEKLKGLIQWLDGLSTKVKTNIMIFAGLAATIGPILIIVGQMALGIGAIIPLLVSLWKMTKVATAHFIAFNMALRANPFILIVTLIAGAIASIVYFSTSSSKMAVDVRNAFRAVANGIIRSINWMSEGINKFSQYLGFTLPIIEEFKMEQYKASDAVDGTAKSVERLAKEMRNIPDNVSTNVISGDLGGGSSGGSGGGSGGGVSKQKKEVTALSLSYKEFNGTLSETGTTMEVVKSKALELGDVTKSQFGEIGEQMKALTGGTYEFEEAFISMTKRMGENLAQGADSFEEYGQTAKGVIRDVIGALISQGVMLAISAALETVMKTGTWWAIPIIAGAAAGLARTAFNTLVPAFAEGGLVTGPTLGLVGEGMGTSAANPEVIAPLDKLKDMIGPNRVEVVGRLKGNDIYLSNARTALLRDRTV